MVELDLGGVATSFLDVAGEATQWILGLAGILVIAIVIFYLMSFRHTVVIRMLTRSGASVPYRDKAREVKKDGGVWWKLLKRRELIPVPPADAVVHVGGSKPRFYAEFCYSEENGYVPLVYDVNTENFDDKVLVEDNGKILSNAFQPFTPAQRSLMVGQLRKAESRRKRSLIDQLTQLAVPMMLVFVLIIGLVFWEDIAKPAKEMSELNLQMQQKNLEIAGELGEISAQNARIAAAVTNEPVPVVQRVDGAS